MNNHQYGYQQKNHASFHIKDVVNSFDIELKVRLLLDLIHYIIGKPNEENWSNKIIEDYFDTFVQCMCLSLQK